MIGWVSVHQWASRMFTWDTCTWCPVDKKHFLRIWITDWFSRKVDILLCALFREQFLHSLNDNGNNARGRAGIWFGGKVHILLCALFLEQFLHSFDDNDNKARGRARSNFPWAYETFWWFSCAENYVLLIMIDAASFAGNLLVCWAGDLKSPTSNFAQFYTLWIWPWRRLAWLRNDIWQGVFGPIVI